MIAETTKVVPPILRLLRDPDPVLLVVAGLVGVGGIYVNISIDLVVIVKVTVDTVEWLIGVPRGVGETIPTWTDETQERTTALADYVREKVAALKSVFRGSTSDEQTKLRDYE